MSAILEAAYAYRSRGWKPIPLLGKCQPLKDWNTDREYKQRDFRNGVALIPGPWSNGLVDIDLDCPEANELADAYLPPTGCEFGRKSKPRSHRMYYAPGATYGAWRDPFTDDKPMMLELRADGESGGKHYTVAPPTWNDKANERVRWDRDGEPATVDAAELRLACAYLASACLVMRYCDGYEGLVDVRRKADVLRACNCWLGITKPIYGFLGLRDHHTEVSRPPRRRFADRDADVPALVAQIVNDFQRPGWVGVGAAIFDAMGDAGWPVFLEFSRQSPRHNHVKTVTRVWEDFRRRGVKVNGLAKLRYLAGGGR